MSGGVRGGREGRRVKACVLMFVKRLQTLIVCSLQAISFNGFHLQWQYLVWKTRIVLIVTFYRESVWKSFCHEGLKLRD